MDGNNISSFSWKSPKAVLFLIALLIIGGVIIVSILREKIINPNPFQISVTGEGRVSYKPDTAQISLGVQVDKMETADAALKELNNKMDKIYSAIVEAGVPKDDIQTQAYSLYPQYDYMEGASKLSGFNANQTILVKVKDIETNSDLVAKVVEVSAAAGANQVNGVTFTNSKIQDLKQEARVKAITDARSKAEGIAGALGVKLGKITGWWENLVYTPDSYSGYFADGKGGGAGGPTIPGGSEELILEANVSYKLK